MSRCTECLNPMPDAEAAVSEVCQDCLRRMRLAGRRRARVRRIHDDGAEEVGRKNVRPEKINTFLAMLKYNAPDNEEDLDDEPT